MVMCGIDIGVVSITKSDCQNSKKKTYLIIEFCYQRSKTEILTIEHKIFLSWFFFISYLYF